MVAFTAGAVLTAANLNTAFNALTIRAVTGTSDTFVLADNGGAVSFSNASPITATVPPFSSVAYANGTVIELLNLGAGVVTVTAGVGVTLNGSIVTLAQNAGGTLIKTATNTWYFLTSASNKVLQVLSTTKVDTFTTTPSTLVDVTGLSVAITPASTSNKVLVTVSLPLSNSQAAATSVGALLRDSTQIGGGTGVGSRGSANARMRIASTSDSFLPISFTFLDSPASVSSLTYKIQVKSEAGGYSAIVGASAGADSDGVTFPRLASTITVMEISA